MMSTGNSNDDEFKDDVKLSVLPKTSDTISKDISGLTRPEKGIVSSAFAKAHEGAEIVIVEGAAKIYIKDVYLVSKEWRW